MIVMDLSGSFADKMTESGKAYNFAMACVNRYFRQGDPLNDRIILAQISGTQESLLWEGTPLDLRRDFPSPASFRDFLLQHADTNGSLVHDGIGHAINYLTTHPRFANGTQSVALILSDMEDIGDDPDSEERLNQAFSAYGRQRGSVGIYFCNQLAVPKWREHLARSGVREYVVEAGFVSKPTLPNFQSP